MKLTAKEKLARIKYILDEAITKYAAIPLDEEDYAYDHAWEYINNIPRGVANELLKLLAEKEE